MEMVPIDRAELSEMVWKSRVKGTPERALARTYGLSVREVQALIDEHIPKTGAGRRRRAQAVILEQLDQLMEHYLPKALADDLQAAAFCLKVTERQSIAYGIEHAPVREAIDGVAVPEYRPNTTERIQEILDRLVNEGKPTVIETEH
jgi:hypothetical protein